VEKIKRYGLATMDRVTSVKGKSIGFGAMDRVAVKLEQALGIDGPRQQ
jgi:hypothetical protein